jgi:hypothetical protein
MTTRLDAKEEIHTLARRLLDDATSAVLGTPLPDSRKFRDGVEEAAIPNGGYYAIVHVKTLREIKLGVGTMIHKDATAESWENKGQFSIKICGAKSADDAYYNCDAICERLKLIFNACRSDSAESNLLTTRARVNDSEPQSGQWFQVYMYADWECEEIRPGATG